MDQPTQAKRKAAALVLAAAHPLDDLLAAARSFGRFDAIGPGTLRPGPAGEPTLYVPRAYEPNSPAPLLVAFHGSGGRGEFAWGGWKTTADALGMIVLAPTEPGTANGYAHSDRERQLALDAIRWARRRFNIDENRVHLTGISRGGHLSWDLVLRRRDRFASAAPFLGSPRVNTRDGQNNFRFLENVVDLPIRDLQGSQDSAWMVAMLREAFARLDGWGARDAQLLEFPEMAHAYSFKAVDWKAFFRGARRDPEPVRVVRAFVLKGEGRAFWVDVLEGDRDVKEEFKIVATPDEVKGMTDAGYRRLMQDHADRHTARLEVSLKGRGSFAATGVRVRKFRLLLSRVMLPEDLGDPVELTWRGKTIRRRVKLDPRVLMREFVERFDRTFLPVAEFRAP